MGFAVFTALAIACLYYGQVLGSRRAVGPWGGFFLAMFLGPIGLLVTLLFPKDPSAARTVS